MVKTISNPSNVLRGMRVVVLRGGPGHEREVSLRSGEAVARALERLGADVVEADALDEGFELPPGRVDMVFNMIHGTFGEDGRLQAELERRGLRFTGEGAEASRVAFDKVESKRRFEAAGVPTASWEVLKSKGERPKMEPPFVVKAPRQGSSVGVHIVSSDGPEMETAIEDCLQLDAEVLVERYVKGRELTVGILGREALPVVEIVPKDGFYDYEHKYTKGGSEYFCPARLSAAEERCVRDAAVAAALALGLEVYGRVDVILDDAGRPCVLEANTIPGMTETSLLPKAAAAAGMSFDTLCLKIAELSLLRHSGKNPIPLPRG